MSGYPAKAEEQAPTVYEGINVEDLNNPEYEDAPQEAQARSIRSADYGEDDLLAVMKWKVTLLCIDCKLYSTK